MLGHDSADGSNYTEEPGTARLKAVERSITDTVHLVEVDGEPKPFNPVKAALR